jgi:uncharacterized protein (DUF433 family)
MAGPGAGPGTDVSADAPTVVRTDDVLGGDPREAHRVGVHHVYQRYLDGGETPEEIAAGYDISVAEVHAALAYAFENADEMCEISALNRRLAVEERSHRVVPDDSTAD